MSSHKVFVYGTLKRGHGNHRLLQDAHFLGEFVTENKWTMYSTGGFPAVVHGDSDYISGEVYEVNDEQFKNLDRLEGYPTMYTRERIEVDGLDELPWMYVWNYGVDNMPVVEGGVW